MLCLAQQRDRPPSLKQAMDDLAQLAHKLVQDAAKSLCKYKFNTGTKHKNCSSPTMVRKAAAVRRLQKLSKYWFVEVNDAEATDAARAAAYQYIRNAYHCTDRYIDKDCVSLKEELLNIGVQEPPEEDDDNEWLYWVHHLDVVVTQQLTELHGRRRHELREKISSHSEKREQSYKDRKLGQYIRMVLGSNRACGLPTEVLTKCPDTGVPVMLTEPDEIKKSWRGVFDAWMGRYRERWLYMTRRLARWTTPRLLTRVQQGNGGGTCNMPRAK